MGDSPKPPPVGPVTGAVVMVTLSGVSAGALVGSSPVCVANTGVSEGAAGTVVGITVFGSVTGEIEGDFGD